MQVSEVMSREVRVANPQQRISEAAKTMKEIDAGVLPVGEGDRLVGMITDRDIAVRAVAAGLGPDTPVREVMTADVRYCYEDEELVDVSKAMAELQVRRLPVVNRDKRLVGILALADIAASESPRVAGKAVEGITRPGGPHAS
jgi:CBS domain-containing protein